MDNEINHPLWDINISNNMTAFIGFEQQGEDGFIIVNKDQIKKISESSGHYACVSLLDGSKLYSLYTVKDFAKLLGLKKEDET